MSVRSRLPWPWRAVVGASLLAVIAGMWWWGFDLGQIFGVVVRKVMDRVEAGLERERDQQEHEAEPHKLSQPSRPVRCSGTAHRGGDGTTYSFTVTPRQNAT